MQIGHTNRSRLVCPDLLVALAFAYCFYFTISTPIELPLYHLLYHFVIDLCGFPQGFIEIWFFFDIEKALCYKELLSFMSFYCENETRRVCYDTKFHFSISPLKIALFSRTIAFCVRPYFILSYNYIT